MPCTTVSQAVTPHGFSRRASVRFSMHGDTAKENFCRAIAPPKTSALHPICV
ncbi:hypothetical protein [Mesorhizobium silamurunense]|uniref:hypothetical protein n=1 Tax=Mesorhizobium silamurunense TaxID=499528 RepID=UPI001783727B|nr:hypothetical protein [Mesorhizobium silamurunense]